LKKALFVLLAIAAMFGCVTQAEAQTVTSVSIINDPPNFPTNAKWFNDPFDPGAYLVLLEYSWQQSIAEDECMVNGRVSWTVHTPGPSQINKGAPADVDMCGLLIGPLKTHKFDVWSFDDIPGPPTKVQIQIVYDVVDKATGQFKGIVSDIKIINCTPGP
jgi:hypothetical protein